MDAELLRCGWRGSFPYLGHQQGGREMIQASWRMYSDECCGGIPSGRSRFKWKEKVEGEGEEEEEAPADATQERAPECNPF